MINIKNIFDKFKKLLKALSDFLKKFSLKKSGESKSEVKDYINIGSYFISKKLIFKVFMLLILLLAAIYGVISNIGFIYSIPLLNKFITPEFYYYAKVLEVFNGEGVILLSDGKPIYEGSIVKGKCDGYGKLYSYDGNNQKKLIYAGFFKENVYDGQCEYWNYARNKWYKGELKNGLKEGKGEEFYVDRTIIKFPKSFNKRHSIDNLPVNLRIYSGEFKNGQYEGTGRLTDFENDIEYTGQFKAGKCEGNGNLKIYGEPPAFREYSGEFKNNLYEGMGKLKVTDKSKHSVIYQGIFKSGKLNGEGVQYFPDNNVFVQYEGTYKNGLLNGEGVKYFPNSKMVQYKGQFTDSLFNGQGQLFDRDRKKLYAGEFRFGSFFKGNIVNAVNDAVISEGVFEKGQLFGQGALFDNNGNKIFEGPVDKDFIDYLKLFGMSGGQLKKTFLTESATSAVGDKILVTYKSLGITLVLSGQPKEADGTEHRTVDNLSLSMEDNPAVVEKIMLWNETSSCRKEFDRFFEFNKMEPKYSGYSQMTPEESSVLKFILNDNALKDGNAIDPKTDKFFFRNYKMGDYSITTVRLKEKQKILFVMLQRN